MQMHGQPLYNKSAVKRRSTLGGLDQYTTPNTKYTGDECPPPPPKKKQKKQKKTTKLFIVAVSSFKHNKYM